nr:ABC transporter substrate-binding protein [Micromonospora sp. DSM 115978]
MAGADVGADVRFQRANDDGGVNGRQINFIGVEDDGQDPARNVQLAQSLVEQDQVFAIAPLISAFPNYLDILCEGVVPFFGWGTNTGYCGNAIGFGFTGCSTPSEETVQ